MIRNKLHRRLRYKAWYNHLIRQLKSVRLNRRRTSLYSTIVIFIDNMLQHSLLNKASGVAFSFTLAIFPSTIFVFTLIPYINNLVPGITEASILSFISNIMPEKMYHVATDTIHDIVRNKREGLLSFGAIFALLLSTNGMHGLMTAFNSIYKTNDSRGFVKTRLIALGLTLMLSTVLFCSIGLLVIGKSFLNYLSSAEIITQDYILTMILWMKYGTIGVAFFIAISLIYYYAPAIHDRWRFFSSGAVFSAVACVMASYAFSFYINHFASYNKFYGSIGMLIALMIWFYLLSIILLIGFEYNASVDIAVDSDKIEVTTSLFE